MKIVIDISDDDYKRICECPDIFNSLTSRLYKIVKQGIPLSKGHGRLGDIDWMLHKMDITDAQPITPNEHYAWDFCKEILNNIPTIIEADREVSE